MVGGYQSSRRWHSNSPGVGPDGLERRPTWDVSLWFNPEAIDRDNKVRRLEPNIQDTHFYIDRPCRLPTIEYIPWIADWGKEGWEKRAVLDVKGLHILYTQAEEPLIPNKHVDGRVSGDIIFAKVAAERREVAPVGWEYEDIYPDWLAIVGIYLDLVKLMPSEFAHGYPKNR